MLLTIFAILAALKIAQVTTISWVVVFSPIIVMVTYVLVLLFFSIIGVVSSRGR
jgi:hypothetical protein